MDIPDNNIYVPVVADSGWVSVCDPAVNAQFLVCIDEVDKVR